MYKGSYATQIDDIYQQIMNRDKFSYDLNSDMLYQQMRDEYTNLGQMAMRDTMGQAAALTGGYGSSYGQAVGQQQYNAYLKSLNEQVPELYGAAYDRYAQEGNDLYQQYNLTADLAADEYNKYQDSLDRYWQERDYNHGNLTTLITNTGYKPTADELAAAGMTQEQADALRLKWAQGNPDMAYRGGLLTNEEYYYLTGIDKNAPVSSGGGYSTDGHTYSYSSSTAADQQRLVDAGYNIAVDGYWGPETQKAAEDYAAKLAASSKKAWYSALGHYVER